MQRETLLKFIRTSFNLLSNFRIEGAENIPANGPVILTTNHISRLDYPALLMCTDREDVIAIVATKYREKIFFRWLIETLRAIWIERETSDFTAFREANEYLNRGWIVGISPEGTRSTTGALQPGKPGAALLVRKTELPILPVAISGTADLGKQLVHLKKTDILVKFGEPYHIPLTKDEEEAKNWLNKASDEIMCRIAALLPPERRGVYADHPRLKEILNGVI
jgi:1-acyl-sn-glycerol-3-phosphate acyltransferase